MPIAPGSRIGPYDVIARLGEGSMGVVFRGRGARLQRDVALKLLPEHFAILWFSRDGKQLGSVGAEANYGNVDLSPQGDRAAVDIVTNGNRDIWVVDLGRSVAQPITFDAGSDWTASWSPDGSRLVFGSTRSNSDGTTKIYEKSSTGAGTETVLPSGDVSSIPVHWSSDGKYIVFSRQRQRG